MLVVMYSSLPLCFFFSVLVAFFCFPRMAPPTMYTLFHAVALGRAGLVLNLLANGNPINEKFHKGGTALFFAALKQSNPGEAQRPVGIYRGLLFS